ncbi:hypothetical protein HID58_028799 [Brassica napus]|uniref:Uncharacterized protein n=1 Tax=Brassica napus TaxID=3708 RepID=A0ABQ8CBD4_BRANA|nr:hypothetical protein HID58_028799 [Brassica napus]
MRKISLIYIKRGALELMFSHQVGHKPSEFYETDSGNDDQVTPKLGTFRHAVVEDEPLCLIFRRDMTIHLKEERIKNTLKTRKICIIPSSVVAHPCTSLDGYSVSFFGGLREDMTHHDIMCSTAPHCIIH